MWPADVAQWVSARPDEFGKTEGVTEEEGNEGNEQRLDRKQSSSQNLMHDLRKDAVQNVTRTTSEESRELQSTPGCFHEYFVIIFTCSFALEPKKCV